MISTNTSPKYNNIQNNKNKYILLMDICIYSNSIKCMGMVNKYRMVILSGKEIRLGKDTQGLQCCL